MLKNWVAFIFIFLVLSCAKDSTNATQYQVVVAPQIGGTVSTTGGAYQSGSEITITATAKDGFQFAGWEGTASGQTNPLTITISGDTNIKAIFTSIKYNLKVDVVGKGGVSKKAVILSRDTALVNETSEEYNIGSTVRLDAIAEDGWIFYRWSGAATSTEKQVDIVINESKVVTATFEERISTTDIIKINLAGVLKNGFQAVGKWKIRRPREEEVEGDARHISGALQCQVSEVVFRTDGSFTISFIDSSIITGFFNPQKIIDETFDIFLTINNKNFGVLRNLTVTNNYINFTYESLACVIPSPTEGDRDRTYVEIEDPNTPTNNGVCKIASLLGTGLQVQTKTQGSVIDIVTFPFYTTCTNQLTATAVNLPEGVTMNFNNNQAVISGTPTENASGTYNYIIRVQSAVASITIAGIIKVNPICYTLGVLSRGGSDQQTISQNIPIDDIVYSLTNKCNNLISTGVSGLPPGVTMTFSNSQAIISGTPTTRALGIYNYVVTASDISTTTKTSFTGVIDVVTTCSIKGVFSGLPTQTVTQTNAITSITYTFNSSCGKILTASVSGLPDGVTMDFKNNQAIISGTPTTAASSGTYNYAIIVNDSLTTSATFSGIIAVVGLVKCSISGVLSSGSQTQTVIHTNAISPITYAFANCGDLLTATDTGLPPGVVMTYNSLLKQAVISGTPTSTASGTYNYNITINDTSRSTTLSGVINIVACTILKGAISGAPIQIAQQSVQIVTVTYNFSSNCNKKLTATLTGSLPAGVSMNFINNQAVISGTPTIITTATGMYDYAVTVTDMATSTTVSGSINVLPPPPCSLSFSISNGTTVATVTQFNVANDIAYKLSKGVFCGVASVTITGLPPGVSMTYYPTSNLAVISGTPTVPGTYNYTLIANDLASSISTTITGTINVTACSISMSRTSGNLAQTIRKGNSLTTNIYDFACSTPMETYALGLPASVSVSLTPNAEVKISASTVSQYGRFNYSIAVKAPTSAGVTYTFYITDSINVTPPADSCVNSIIRTGGKTTLTLTRNQPIPAADKFFVELNDFCTRSGPTTTVYSDYTKIVSGLPPGITLFYSASGDPTDASSTGPYFELRGISTASGIYHYELIITATSREIPLEGNGEGGTTVTPASKVFLYTYTGVITVQ